MCPARWPHAQLRPGLAVVRARMYAEAKLSRASAPADCTQNSVPTLLTSPCLGILHLLCIRNPAYSHPVGPHRRCTFAAATREFMSHFITTPSNHGRPHRRPLTPSASRKSRTQTRAATSTQHGARTLSANGSTHTQAQILELLNAQQPINSWWSASRASSSDGRARVQPQGALSARAQARNRAVARECMLPRAASGARLGHRRASEHRHPGTICKLIP